MRVPKAVKVKTRLINSTFKPMLYSGASLLLNNIDHARVVRHFDTCLWPASYATMGRIDSPNFNYFPSMDGVAIWQFTDIWKGLVVDGSISLIDLEKATKVHKQAIHKQAKPKIVTEVYASIINNDPNWKIALRDSKGKLTHKYIKTNSRWKVIETKTIAGRRCYRLGTEEQWAPAQFFKVTKTK